MLCNRNHSLLSEADPFMSQYFSISIQWLISSKYGILLPSSSSLIKCFTFNNSRISWVDEHHTPSLQSQHPCLSESTQNLQLLDNLCIFRDSAFLVAKLFNMLQFSNSYFSIYIWCHSLFPILNILVFFKIIISSNFWRAFVKLSNILFIFYSESVPNTMLLANTKINYLWNLYQLDNIDINKIDKLGLKKKKKFSLDE